jgi:hypothetical protein
MQNASEIHEPDVSKTAAREVDCAEVPYHKPQEIGGPAGLEPTRFGDWERKGRCIDF